MRSDQGKNHTSNAQYMLCEMHIGIVVIQSSIFNFESFLNFIQISASALSPSRCRAAVDVTDAVCSISELILDFFLRFCSFLPFLRLKYWSILSDSCPVGLKIAFPSFSTFYLQLDDF